MDIFILLYPFSPLSPSLWETARYRLKYCLKGPLNPKQPTNYEIFEGLQGVTSICDDILVFGRSRAEHGRNLETVLQKSRVNGLRFNPEKCQIGLTEVKYFGQVISSRGLLPDPGKVSAILNMPNPTNRSELETLLGMITYLTKFQKNLSDITSPMREILRNDTEWCWEKRQSDAFQQMKTAITKTPVLSYYDRNKPVRLQVDASSKGLGACRKGSQLRMHQKH